MRNRHSVRAGYGARGPVPKQPCREKMRKRRRSASKTMPPQKANKCARARTALRLKREAQEYARGRADNLERARKAADSGRDVLPSHCRHDTRR